MYQEIRTIAAKEDFVRFLRRLSMDALLHPEEWENRTVPEYLEQVASWIEDFSESPANDIDWDNMEFRTLARMLYMGKLYE
ncbi:MAG: hypothetical protein KH009_07655 [Clostridiales bacterium]|nr:hypothetical protein [Clostridiales bacterium]